MRKHYFFAYVRMNQIRKESINDLYTLNYIQNNQNTDRAVFYILMLVAFILKFSRDHNSWIRGIIDGKPVQVIKDGKVLVGNCMKAGISANELMFKLRGIYSVEKVKNCIFEQNGQLTIIENDEANIRFPIISDGQANVDVLELIHKDESWLEHEVEKAGYNNVNDVFLGEYIDGKLHFTGYTK